MILNIFILYTKLCAKEALSLEIATGRARTAPLKAMKALPLTSMGASPSLS